MTRLERCLAAAVFLSALVCILLATATPVYANNYCVWFLDCHPADPAHPELGQICEITNLNCSPFFGECDFACDQEYSDCLADCQAESGIHCNRVCDPVYIACIGSCIPWV